MSECCCCWWFLQWAKPSDISCIAFSAHLKGIICTEFNVLQPFFFISFFAFVLINVVHFHICAVEQLNYFHRNNMPNIVESALETRNNFLLAQHSKSAFKFSTFTPPSFGVGLLYGTQQPIVFYVLATEICLTTYSCRFSTHCITRPPFRMCQKMNAKRLIF